MDEASEDAPIEPTTAEDPSLLHFTSGTTGTPKVPARARRRGHALQHRPVRPRPAPRRHLLVHGRSRLGDRNLIRHHRPLLHGVTSIIDEAEFDAQRWYQILQDEEVSVWYTAPTAIRMLIKAGPELPSKYRFPHLRFIASVGEPLNAEAVWWGKRALGLPIHDNWWQTETGGIMVANTPAFDIKPGSMGRPLPASKPAW